MRRPIQVLAFLLLVSPAALADTLYRWVGPDGNVVMSDRPPPAGTAYETVSTSPSMVVNSADPVNVPKLEVEQPSAKKESKEPETTSYSVYKKNPEYCAGARQNLATLERPRIRIVGEDGEARFLTEEERAEERRKALEVIELHCE